MSRTNGSEDDPVSRMIPYGYQTNSCGYCKADGSSASYYARSQTLSPELYQRLVDRGWRRSGDLLYLPDASRSCCRHYTIRLPASELKPTRDQRQALNRWNRFVVGEKYLQDLSVKFPKSKEEKKRKKHTFDLIESVHECEQAQVKPGLESNHAFEVTLEPDRFTEEKYALFENYQRHVHHEGSGQISRSGFRNFLCSSPLHRSGGDGDDRPLGSFHQCYRLDGRLVAMGVLDLLPHAVSGVYFIYHSDFDQWSFGKLSALRECALARERGYRYYYMGYYIHNCSKMRYKADYHPQFVLDVDSLEWHPLDDAMRALMARAKYRGMTAARARRSHAQQRHGGGMDVDAPAATAASAVPDDADTDDDDDEDNHVILPAPQDATESGWSLFELGMPGVLSVAQVERDIDLDEMKLALARYRGVYHMKDLVAWTSGSMLDHSSLKGLVAEFAATVGPEVAREVVVDLGA